LTLSSESKLQYREGILSVEQMDRRRFVATVSSGLTGVALSAAAGEAPTGGKIPRIVLGRTKLEVSRIALGTVSPPDRAVLAYCAQQGLNFIDAAPNYANGRSEEAVGQRFRELGLKRDQFILTSKTKSRDPSQWPNLIAESCKRMGTDRLDIFHAHSIGGWGGRPGQRIEDSTTWLLKSEVARAVAELKKSGLIRAFGYSCHVTQRDWVNELIRESAKGEHIDVLMVRYNFRELGDRELAESLAIAHKAGQGVVAMKSQAGAKDSPDKVKPFLEGGFNHWQAAIRWAASNPSVHVVCANMTTLEMARDNLTAIKQPHLSARELNQLMLYAQATASNACRMCATCVPVCPRGIAIPEILRAVMYHDDYGDGQMARQTYGEINPQWRADRCGDCGTCERVCPNGLTVRSHLARAARVFSLT